MKYTVLTPRKIVFGWGRRAEVGELAARLGRRAWIVCGSRTLQEVGTIADLQDRLSHAGVASEVLETITREPEVDDVDAIASRLIETGLQDDDFVIGIGGGAGLDAAKAVSALATNRHGSSVRDFLEGVGEGLTIDADPLPMLAIPTTAGTGTEATKNAVISCFDPPFKKSLRSERMMPDVVLVDPELTVSCPPSVTAQSGMDAITQLIESLLSSRATVFTQGLCREALFRVLSTTGRPPAIVRAVESPDDRSAREAMAHAALSSGMALANSGLGMAHGVAAALGVQLKVPHGLACAIMLPIAMTANREVRRAQLAELGTVLTGTVRDEQTSSAMAVSMIEEINQQIGIPSCLSELGVNEENIPAIVASSRGNSMNGNPREIDDDELTAILTANL